MGGAPATQAILIEKPDISSAIFLANFLWETVNKVELGPQNPLPPYSPEKRIPRKDALAGASAGLSVSDASPGRAGALRGRGRVDA